MKEIFSNFYIIIPIAIVIALRILEARNKVKAKERQDTASPLREPDRGSGLTPFGGSGSSLPHWVLREDDDDEEAPVSPKQSPVNDTGIPLFPPPDLASEYDEPEDRSLDTGDLAIRGASPQAEVPAGSPAQCFPANLEYLPPLKRALVLTEILGIPKGLL